MPGLRELLSHKTSMELFDRTDSDRGQRDLWMLSPEAFRYFHVNSRRFAVSGHVIPQV